MHIISQVQAFWKCAERDHHLLARVRQVYLSSLHFHIVIKIGNEILWWKVEEYRAKMPLRLDAQIRMKQERKQKT